METTEQKIERIEKQIKDVRRRSMAGIAIGLMAFVGVLALIYANK